VTGRAGAGRRPRTGEVDWDAQGERYARSRHAVTDTAAYAEPVAGILAGAPAGPLIDVGAGTGIWSARLARWTGRPVLAVEPAPGMRRHAANGRQAGVHRVAGRVPDLPLAAGSASGAWLSAVLHHVGDMAACAHELRRVLAPGGLVLVRGAFAGRLDHLPQHRYFPEVARGADRFPTVEATDAAFATARFRRARHDVVEEQVIDLREWRRHLPDQRRSDTSLAHLTDAEFAAGLARVDADIAARTPRPATALDLLVYA
jgi:SAM-dependent methyltransferase